jgi:hypothetical protein
MDASEAPAMSRGDSDVGIGSMEDGESGVGVGLSNEDDEEELSLDEVEPESLEPSFDIVHSLREGGIHRKARLSLPAA